MSVRIQHLNDDASFLLEFRDSSSCPVYRVAIDPWLQGPSTIFHQLLSKSTMTRPSLVESLTDLPQPLDAIIISQTMTDHCHQQTLTRLPPDGPTMIFAEPAAAKTILGWKHFKREKVVVLPVFNKSSEVRAVPILCPHSEKVAGELSITIVEQAMDLTGCYKGVGILYQPFSPISTERASISPPQTPLSICSTLVDTNRPLSILHVPHGIKYASFEPYLGYLQANDALPLTAMLHCFDKISNPFYLGGAITTGAHGGLELAKKLTPLAWISAHDADKKLKGLTTKKIRIEKYSKEGVGELLSPLSPTFPDVVYVEAMVLDCGAEVVYSQASHREIKEQSRMALTPTHADQFRLPNSTETYSKNEQNQSNLSWTSITSYLPYKASFWSTRQTSCKVAGH